jgi:hypothetical protein
MSNVTVEPETGATPPARKPSRRGAGGAGSLPAIVIAVALVAAGVGAIVVSQSYNTPHKVRALGANLAIDDGAANPLDLGANNSPALVRNPVDANNLVSANRIDSPNYSCAVNVSFDGGGRWTQTAIPAPAGEEPKCYAPDVAFSPKGTLYLSFVTLKGRANSPNNVWMSRSTDGGKTLSAPVKTPLGSNAFQVRLTADPRSDGRVFLTWLKASELGLYALATTGNPIMAIRSDDGGSNWTQPTRVSSSARQRVVAPSPVAGSANGELDVLYLDLGNDSLDYAGGHKGRGGPPFAGPWQLVLARSTDNGATWKESVVDPAIKPTERFVVFTPPYPSLAVDQNSGRMYASFQDGRLGDADVWLWSLGRGASSWSKPVRVNDTPARDRTAQYLPKLSVAPDGRLDVMYYDRRADRTNVLNEVSLQSSFDDGKTFLPRVQLSDRAFSSRIGFGLERGLPDLGSRLGLVSTNSRAYGVWTDTRGGSVKTAKQDIARGVAAFNDPARLSSGAKAALLVGGILLALAGLAVAGLPLARRRRTAG